jgi:ABC-type glycerol-3-phosphate transport system permease component
MPILNTLQRRSTSGRLLLTAFYAILLFGAFWMVYPFLMMLGGSVKTDVDYRQSDIVPRFLFNEEMLFRKFQEQRYGRIDIAIATTGARGADGERLYTFENFPRPAPNNGQALRDWQTFLDEEGENLPKSFFGLGHLYGPRTMPEVLFRYQKALQCAFPLLPAGELGSSLPLEDWPSRNYQPPAGERGKIYDIMRSALSGRYLYPISLDGNFALNAAAPVYGYGPAGLRRLNREWETDYRSVQDVRLRGKLPENPAERTVWETYVRNFLSPRFLRFPDSLRPQYLDFLRQKYGGLSEVNAAYAQDNATWDQIDFPGPDASPASLHDAAVFVQTMPDLNGVSVRGLENVWRDHVERKYGDIASLNVAWQTRYRTYDEIRLPALEQDWKILKEYKMAILWELVSRNYRVAWDAVVLNGNALRNTVIFCFLNVMIALVVNPLAAYALSRFQPSWGQGALFLLMATMAFPGEVTQIPAFLLLRDLGWLNTFAALVVPAAANGYSIFLLKGFFDSLPKELYEAATIDGSGELRAFFTITLPLSAPILAVVALAAFAAAYGAFMFALLVCQKESMWTLMVYIYQLQQSYNPPTVFAALVIAAIPTLVVFVLCQNIIMKGIVVPVEK